MQLLPFQHLLCFTSLPDPFLHLALLLSLRSGDLLVDTKSAAHAVVDKIHDFLRVAEVGGDTTPREYKTEIGWEG